MSDGWETRFQGSSGRQTMGDTVGDNRETKWETRFPGSTKRHGGFGRQLGDKFPRFPQSNPAFAWARREKS